jgi:hypothetical protein
MKKIINNALIIIFVFMSVQNAYCQDLKNIVSTIENVIKREFVQKNYLTVESKNKCYTAYRYWLPNVGFLSNIFDIKKVAEQVKIDVIDFEENLYTYVIISLPYAVVQNNSKSDKANKEGCFNNENDALRATSESDFNDSSEGLKAFGFMLFFRYDKLNSTANLLTPKKESPDLRQSRRLGYVNRSKRYLEKIL